MSSSSKCPSLYIEIRETDGCKVMVTISVLTEGQTLRLEREVNTRNMTQCLNEFKDYLQAAILSPENEIVLRIPEGVK